MAKILRKATVGNADTNADCVVSIEPYESGIKIELDSFVKKQYGDQIEETIKDELNKYGIENAFVYISDKGAIDPVLRARLEVAIKRSIQC